MNVLGEFVLSYNEHVQNRINLGKNSAQLVSNELKTLSGKEQLRVKGQTFCISGINCKTFLIIF